MKIKNITYLIVCFMIVVVVLLWNTGVFGLWANGIAYIANNTKSYTKTGGHLLEGNYTLEIDLSHLESNIGKDIYHDREHRIYVSSLRNTLNGAYDVGFRSSGHYSLSGATLISALFHETNNDHSFTTSATANMIVEHEGQTYDAQVTGLCGINYKDGDCFSISFFLKEESNVENAKNSRIVNLTVTDLYKNIWKKK